MDRKQVADYLSAHPEALQRMELLGPHGQSDRRKSEKLHEVAGFSALILRYVRKWLKQSEPLNVLECSCGKSYLGFALALLLRELEHKSVRLWGVDFNADLIERCASVADALGLQQARFTCTSTAQFQSKEHFHLAVSLHACDTATDEAIAKAIELGAELILAVPCCQNQIRGQLKGEHPLTAITDFGPARYRLANLLTDSLRAQFLRSAGYQVEMDEIGSPKVTPKNLCICARKLRHKTGAGRDREYRKLRDMFGLRPKIEALCPGVVSDPQQ